MADPANELAALKLILAELTKISGPLAKISPGKDKPKNPKDSADNLDDLADASENATKGITKLDMASAWLKKTMGVGKYAMHSINSVSKTIFDFKNVISGLVYGTVFATLAEHLTKTSGLYREFFDVGQNFSGSIMEMQMVAAKAGMSMEDLAKYTKTAAGAAAMMGMKSFVALNKNVKTSLKEFGQFGLTTQEVDEYLGKYLETQTELGTAQSMSGTDLKNQFVELAGVSQNLSDATGKSKKAIMEFTQQMAKSPALFGYLNSLPKSMSTSVNSGIQKAMAMFAVMPDEVANSLGQSLSEGLALGNTAMSSTFSSMGAFFNGKVVTSFDNIRNQIETGGDVAAATADFYRDLKETGPEAQRMLAQLAATGDQEAASMLKMISGANKMTEAQLKQLESSERLKKTMEGPTETMMNFGVVAGRVSGNLRALGLKVAATIIDTFKLGEVFTAAAEYIEKLMGSKDGIDLGTVVRDLTAILGPPIQKSIASAMGKVKEIWSELFPRGLFAEIFPNGIWEAIFPEKERGKLASIVTVMVDKLGIIGAALTAFAVLVGGKALITKGAGMAAGAIGNKLFGGGGATGAVGGTAGGAAGAAGGAAAGGAGGSLAGAAGKLGGLGGMLEGLTGGLLKGLAPGLTAFANPAILLGASIFGLSLAIIISSIGVGLAGALAAIGLALPTFAEGLQAFDNLDTKKLKEVGAAVSELGSGMLKMGAGELTNALGSISKLWGGDLVSKLKDISELGPKLGEGGRGMTDFAAAMDLLKGPLTDSTTPLKGLADAYKYTVNAFKTPISQDSIRSLTQITDQLVRGSAASGTTGSPPSPNKDIVDELKTLSNIVSIHNGQIIDRLNSLAKLDDIKTAIENRR
jgi:hypothetical protein